jgi:hypothetical protein
MPETAISDYTNRDFSSLVESLLEVAALKVPEWTDRSENDLGRLMLELFAYVGDVVFYYQDRVANEAFLETAVERRSVIDLLALIGYTLSTPGPASADLRVTAPNDSVNPVTVQIGATFSTVAAPGKPAIDFIYLPVTGLPLSVPRNGTGGTVQFDVGPVLNAVEIANESLGTSNGEANQSFKLAQRPVLLPRDPDSQDWLTVEVDATGGGSWERWERHGTFLYSLSGDQHFVVRTDADDQSSVFFGDGQYGRIPPPGALVRASYLTGGGEAGNTGPGTITVMKSGVDAQVTPTNPLGATGGADRESIEHARRHAPDVFRSLQRAVTAGDYAALAENYPGVERAAAVAPAWNFVDVYVVPSGGSNITDELRAGLLRYFETRRLVTTLVHIRDPVYVSINITIEIGAEPTFYAADVEARVRSAVEALFEIDALDFGQPFYVSKVYEAVEAVEGVHFADVTQFVGRRSQPPNQLVVSTTPGRIPLRSREFPRQGTLTTSTTGGL